MYGKDGMDDMASSKMSSLRDLIGEMKKLHGDKAKPKGMAIEMHETHMEPLSPEDVEGLEEATHQDLDGDNEKGESPEHQEMVLGHSDEDQDEDQDHDEDQDEQEPEMQIPEGLLRLIAEKLAK